MSLVLFYFYNFILYIETDTIDSFCKVKKPAIKLASNSKFGENRIRTILNLGKIEYVVIYKMKYIL